MPHGVRIRRLGALAAAAVVLGGGSAVASQPAGAGSNLCPSNQVCIYVDANFIGLLGHRGPGGGLVNLTGGANDKMSSWENKTWTHAAWYQHQNGGGFCRTMGLRSEKASLSWFDNDEMSSWRTNRGC